MTDKYIPAELSQQQVASNEAMKPRYEAFKYSIRTQLSILQKQAYTGIDRVFCEVINGIDHDPRKSV